MASQVDTNTQAINKLVKELSELLSRNDSNPMDLILYKNCIRNNIGEITNEELNYDLQFAVNEISSLKDMKDIAKEIVENYSVNSISENKSLSLRESVNDKFYPFYEYRKYDDEKLSHRKQTGNGIKINEANNLGNVDCDLPKNLKFSLPNDEIDAIRNEILKVLPENGITCSQTGSRMLHTFCRKDNYNSEKAANVKGLKIEVNGYQVDIDIFVSGSDKQSWNVLPPSVVKYDVSKDNPEEHYGKYEFVRGDLDSPITHSIQEIIDILKTNFKVIYDQKEVKKQVVEKKITENKNIKTNNSKSENHKEFKMDNDCLEAFIDGIREPIVLHHWIRNDRDDENNDSEWGLWDIFPGILAITDKKLLERALSNLENVLVDETKKSQQNVYDSWLLFKSRFEGEPSLWYLHQFIKTQNPEYYKSVIIPMYKSFSVKEIDWNSDFDWCHYSRNAAKGMYKSYAFAGRELTKIFRYIQPLNAFVQKVVLDKENDDSSRFSSTLSYRPFKAIERDFQLCKLFETDENGNIIRTESDRENAKKIKTVTAWDVFKKYNSHFIINGVNFVSHSPDYLSYFRGYKYPTVDEVDESKFADIIALIREGICDEEEIAYNYLIRLIAWIFQHPGKKSGVGVVLKGLEGCGKNTFTNILSDLLGELSARNLTSINQVTGEFNAILENKMLVVCNELKSVRGEYLENMDALKTIVTDDTIPIRRMRTDLYQATNVNNFIFISNHEKPLLVKATDRRYFVLNCSPKFIGNFDFFKRLNNLSDESYSNFLTYLLKMDLSDFDVKNIPITTAKRNLIRSCFTEKEQFIVDHYNDFVNGITLTDIKRIWLIEHPEPKEWMPNYTNELKNWKKEFNALKSFLQDKCKNSGRHTLNNYKGSGKNIKGYVLLDHCADRYKPDEEDEEEEDIF